MCVWDVPFAGHVLSACVSWRLPACARASDLGWGLAPEIRGGWGVGMDATALTRDCPKPADLIRITPIIFLSLSLFLSLFPSIEPLLLLSRPRSSSFSCSCFTPPSTPYNRTQKNTKLLLAVLLPWWPLVPLLFIPAIDLFLNDHSESILESLFLMPAFLFNSYLTA